MRQVPDALARMAGFMVLERRLPTRRDDVGSVDMPRRRPPVPIPLASGVPHQELGTFSERLLLPLIHFVLMGYPPMPFMRRTKRAEFSAGCGRLFIARADAYHATEGHAMIRATLHDGIKLPRLFRRTGFQTDHFDATDIATCRMHATNGETWRGVGKNATEGLAAPGTILPMIVLLFGGQVLLLLLLAAGAQLSSAAVVLAFVASMLAYLPRFIGVLCFRQPPGSALLHPLGVVALLVIQWHALARHLLGRPAE